MAIRLFPESPNYRSHSASKLPSTSTNIQHTFDSQADISSDPSQASTTPSPASSRKSPGHQGGQPVETVLKEKNQNRVDSSSLRKSSFKPMLLSQIGRQNAVQISDTSLEKKIIQGEGKNCKENVSGLMKKEEIKIGSASGFSSPTFVKKRRSSLFDSSNIFLAAYRKLTTRSLEASKESSINMKNKGGKDESPQMTLVDRKAQSSDFAQLTFQDGPCPVQYLSQLENLNSHFPEEKCKSPHQCKEAESNILRDDQSKINQILIDESPTHIKISKADPKNTKKSVLSVPVEVHAELNDYNPINILENDVFLYREISLPNHFASQEDTFLL